MAVAKRTEENSINLGAIKGVQFGNQNVSGFAMHSQSLLTMGLLSDTFRQATVQVQNALPLLLSTKYYSEETRESTRKNFLLDLIRSEQASPYNSKLDHFANDLSKLGTNLAGLNKAAQEAIVAQGIEWYYWQTSNYSGQEFISVTSNTLQYTSAQGEGLTGALNKANLYTTPWLSALLAQNDKQVIKTDYQQWNVATNAGGTATARDTNKDQIFIGSGSADTFTGGSKDDALIGGGGNDTLDGQGGNDKLYGGAGADNYQFTGNWGKDQIIDSDGSGSIQIGSDTLGKFEGNGGGYAFKLASGEYAGLVIRDDQSSTLTKKTAYIVKGTDQNNVIAIRNFDEAAAKSSSGNGYLGIKLDTTQRVALIQGDGKTLGAAATNYWADINSAASALEGKESTFAEGNGKTFTVSLAVAAQAGDTLTLNIDGALGGQLKAILGDSTVDANGAEITLTEGQTFVSFALVSDSEITADQLGSISAQYQTDSNDPNGSAGNAAVSSNIWGLTLKDAGEIENTLRGDYTVKTDTTNSNIYRYNPDVERIVVVEEGALYYVRDGQGNLVADANGTLVTDNVLFGGAGRDKIDGLDGNDVLIGAAGQDQIDGGEGADLIAGGAGADHILGGAGNDYISSSSDGYYWQQVWSADDVWKNWATRPSEPPQIAYTTWGKDVSGEYPGITYPSTNSAPSEGDYVDAGAGDDDVYGSWANDRIQGGQGHDLLLGMAGDDIIEGNEDNDTLMGDALASPPSAIDFSNSDTVEARQHGNDFLDGGSGSDLLDGGAGATSWSAEAAPMSSWAERATT